MNSQILSGFFKGENSHDVIPYLLVVMIALVTTFILVRRQQVTFTLMELVKKYLLTLLSVLLLLVSGLWSGWAMYNRYAGQNELKAQVICAGFLLCGGALSIALNFFANKAIREQGPARVVIVTVMVLLSTIWMGVSPLLNARFLSEDETIRLEIGQRFSMLDDISEPLLNQYTFYQTRLLPKLQMVQEHLLSQVKVQTSDEMGGCGSICKQFQSVAALMDPTVQRLYMIFDPDDDERDLKGRVHQIRNRISNLLADNDLTPEELKTAFYSEASGWVDLLWRAKNVENPATALNFVMIKLDDLLDFLRKYRKAYSSGVRATAADRSLSTLEPMVNDLRLSWGNHTPAQEEEKNTMFGKINLADLASIRMNPMLMHKHLYAIWPDMLVAYLIDIIALSFVFAPMAADLLTGRPVRVERERAVKSKIQLRLLQKKREDCIQARNRCQARQERIKQHYDVLLSDLEKEHKRSMAGNRSSEQEMLNKIDRQRASLLQEQRKKIEAVNKEQRSAMLKATSTNEEDLIRGRHELYRDNIRKEFSSQFDGLAREKNDLQKRFQENRNRMDTKYANQRKRIISLMNKKMRTLEKKMKHLDEQEDALTQKIDKAGLQLQRAEDRLSTFGYGGSGSFNRRVA